MPLRIEQSSEPSPTNPERWRWSVWLEGSAAELDAVGSVHYQLHPTFQNPSRLVRDRATKFKLKSAGWGEFLIYGLVRFRNESRPELTLNHWLRLGEKDQPGVNAPAKLRVFVAYDFADEPSVEAVINVLVDNNVDIVNPSVNTHVSTMRGAFHSLDADVALFFIGSNVGRFVRYELKRMREHDVDVLPVVSPEAVNVAKVMFGDRQQPFVAIDFKRDPLRAAAQLLEQMPALCRPG